MDLRGGNRRTWNLAREGLAPQDKGGPRIGTPPLVLMGRAVCAEKVGPWLCGLWERSRIPFEASLGAFGPSRAAAEAAWEGLGASRAARRGRPDDS